MDGPARSPQPEDLRTEPTPAPHPASKAGPPACPACGGPLVEIRAKLVCSRCRTICETCCEGGRG